MSVFTEAQIAGLRDIRALWPGVRLVLVGASALGVHKPMHWRRTNDLDLSVSMSISEFPAGLESLPGWSRHPFKEQEFMSPRGVRVDVVPAGSEHIAKGYLDWPSGFRMTLLGMRLVFEHAEPLPVTDVPGLELAPLAVLALLKMVAWQDRPADRQRDLDDLAHVIDEYVEPGDEEFYSEFIEQLRVEFDLRSSFLLGLHIGRLVNADELAVAERFLARLHREGTPYVQMSRFRGWGPDDDLLEARLKSLHRGLRMGVDAQK
jgi:predicted nucleotidyltransferase